MIIMAFLSIFVLFDPSLRNALGDAAGVGLTPAFGFGGSYPALTFLLAGSLTTIISSVSRHFFTDWVRMARINKQQRALQKALMDSLRKGQAKKVERLRKVQNEMRQETSTVMLSAQWKPLAFTLLPFSVVYAWLYKFVYTDVVGRGHLYFAVPWASQANFLAIYGWFQAWLLLYIVLAIPIGQVVARLLKLFSFRKRLAALAAQGGAG